MILSLPVFIKQRVCLCIISETSTIFAFTPNSMHKLIVCTFTICIRAVAKDVLLIVL